MPKINILRLCCDSLFHRLEQVNILRRDGLAKVLGTIASVGGATIITLYKGFPLLHTTLTLTEQPEEDMFLSPNKMQSRTLGCIFLLGHCLSWAGWLVLQVGSVKYRSYKTVSRILLYVCFFWLGGGHVYYWTFCT